MKKLIPISLLIFFLVSCGKTVGPMSLKEFSDSDLTGVNNVFVTTNCPSTNLENLNRLCLEGVNVVSRAKRVPYVKKITVLDTSKRIIGVIINGTSIPYY